MAKKAAKKASSAKAAAKKSGAKKKKKKKKRKSSRKKSASEARKKLVWGVFSSSMKEEGRFPYDQRKEAEKKLEQLSAKSKKQFFIQPMKEVISESGKKTKKKTKPKTKKSGEEE